MSRTDEQLRATDDLLRAAGQSLHADRADDAMRYLELVQ